MAIEQGVMYGSCAQCHRAASLPWKVTRQTPNSFAMSYLDYNCCSQACAAAFAQRVGGDISAPAPTYRIDPEAGVNDLNDDGVVITVAEMTFECAAPATSAKSETVAYQGVYWRFFWNAQKMTKTHLFKHFPDRGYADISPEEGVTVCGEHIPNYFYPVDLRGVTVGAGICKKCSALVNPVTRPLIRVQCLNCGLTRELQRKPARCIRCHSTSLEAR